MADFPARCLKCGRWSRVSNFLGGDIRDVTVIGVITMCPYCTGPAAVQDGVYSMTNDVLSIIDVDAASRGEVERVLGVFRQARQERWSTERLVLALEQHRDDPFIQRLLSLLNDNPGVIAVLMPLLLFALGKAFERPPEVHVHIGTQEVIEHLLESGEHEALNALLNLQEQDEPDTVDGEEDRKTLRREETCDRGTNQSDD